MNTITKMKNMRKIKLLLLLLAVFTISSNAQTQVVTGINIGIALDYDGNHLYIAELFGNKISRIDLTVGASSYEVVTNISRPEGVAINGNEVYTAGIQLGGAVVADISGSLPTTSNNIAAGGNIRTVVFDTIHGLYLIKTDGSSNTKIYSITGTTQTFIVDVGVGDIRAATIKGSEMYLSSRGGGAIYKFDLNNVATPTLVKSGLNQPYEIEIVNNDLYFASEGGILGKFDLTNTTATPTIFVNNTLGDLAGIEVIGEDIYFTSWGNNAVYKINDPDLIPCIVNIPDTNFKNYLVGNTTINTNGDTEIQCSEASAFTGTIIVSNQNISDLTGIETFANVTGLRCDNNSLTSLYLYNNSNLTDLRCNNNSLEILSMASGNNTAITVFTSRNNSNLTCIQVDNASYSTTNWTNIDAGIASFSTNCNYPCEAITIPDANFKAALVANASINTNNDTEISCTEATAFTGILTIQNLSITDLTGIEAFTNIIGLFCQNNSLTNLDVSNSTALIALTCQSNTLTSLNVANGNNTNVVNFNASNNPSLTCITVDNVTYSDSNWTVADGEIDAQTSFSTNCTSCTVNILDANFKTYLVGNTVINTNGDTEIQCSEATAFTGAIDCSSLNISDLTGIESFINITQLHCVNNLITNLDLSSNTALTTIFCYDNSLTSIDVSSSANLTVLQCYRNSLTGLDVSNNTALTTLYCYNNLLPSLDVTQNTALINFSSSNNLFTSLDVSNNSALTFFLCSNNSLTDLNMANGANTNITNGNFASTGNPNLTCIQVDDVAYSTTNWTNIDAQTSFSTNCTAIATTTYVNHAATGNNDGTTWANAYTHLENALAVATDGNEIWIATGTYLPNITGSQTTPFNVNNADLKIYGGFLGTETQLSDRVLGTNETILSGDLNGNDVFVSDHFTNNYNHATKTDNSRNIINITALGNNLLLDGLTISNAHNITTTNGAIIKEKTVVKLTLTNCTIKNNIAQISSGLFAEFDLNNTSGTRGSLIIENCIFKNNMSRYASGIYSYARANTSVDIKVENTLFDNNIAGNLNTAVRGLSGAASWFRSIGINADVALKLINNTYANNICDSDGNSINDSNRATVAINKTAGTLNAEVVNCIFWNNYRPTSTSNIAMRSITNTYNDAVQSIVVKNAIDELNFNDASITSTVNTSNANPLFVHINSNLSLQPGSPAINTGDNSYVTTTSDLIGNQRIFNGIVDMGCYESLAILTYDLTTNIVGSGSVSPSGTTTHNDGTVVNVTATPATGWSFDGWSGASTSVNSSISITMDADKTLTATFSQIQYELTIIENDGIVIPDSGTLANGVYTYNDGTVVEITAVANSGFVFDHYEVTDSNGTINNSANPLSITMNDNMTVEAIYIATYDLTTTVVGSGSVSPSGTTTHNDGTVVNVTATPATGWLFDGWSGASTSVNSSISITMNADKTLTATFSQIQYELTIVENDGIVTPDSGTLANGVYTYNDGTIVEITAVANSGFVFDHYEVTDSNGTTNNSANPLLITMNDNMVVEAIYIATYDLTTNIVGSGSVSPSGTTTHNDGTIVNVTATPATGWLFDGWSGASTSVNSSISITMDADKTLTATFSQIQYELTIIENDGIVTPDSGTLANGVYTYNDGTIVEITAVANSGFVFDHYEVTDSNGTTNNSANPLSITMSDNMVVEAIYTSTAGINDIINLNFMIYPNPVNNLLNIQLDQNIKNIEIFNLIGQKVIESKSKQINVSNLENGIYLIKVNTLSNKSVTKRFVKK